MRLFSRSFRFCSEHAVALAALAACAILLLPAPVVGIADNGDFARVMGAGGLEYADRAEPWNDRYFRYSHHHYAYGRFGTGGYGSSQLPLLFAAGSLSRLFAGRFDIRLLSMLYALLLAAALYTLVKAAKTRSRWANGLLAAALALVFLDIGYLAYFNSLYGEPAAMIFFLLTAGLGLRAARAEDGSPRPLLRFYAAAAALACAKLQYAPIGLAFALFGLRLRQASPARPWRRTAAAGAAALLLLSAGMVAAAPSGLKEINLYQTVFYGVLKDSPTPGNDLQALGLKKELAVLAGTNYFQKDVPIPKNDPRLTEGLYPNISHLDILRFYAARPERLVQKLERAAANGMYIRPYYLGNYEKAAGKPPGALAHRFSAWSEFKRAVLPHRLAVVLSVFAAYLGLAAPALLRPADAAAKRSAEMHLCIAAAGGLAFLVPILGDGEADLAKHLFLFNVCFDWMAVYAGVLLFVRLGAFARRLRERRPG